MTRTTFPRRGSVWIRGSLALLLCLGASSARAQLTDSFPSVFDPKIDLPFSGGGPILTGVNAYIYGYPLVVLGTTKRVATAVPNNMAVMGRAPVNQFYLASGLPDSSYRDVVLPSTTTLYGNAFLDLTNEPMVLHIPQIDGRFFIFQVLDGWTNVIPNSPSTRLGTQQGDYMFVGPKWNGDTPAGITEVITMPTETMWIINRVYTSGSGDDISYVVNSIFGNTKLIPLSYYSQHIPYTPPDNVPVDPTVDTTTPPLEQVQNMDACAFFGTLAALMKSNPPVPADADTVKQFASIGLVPGQSFDCGAISATTRAALQLAVILSRALLNNTPNPSPTRTNWSLPLNVGSYGTQYYLRAVIAKKALGANRPEDAVYGGAEADRNGDQLSGAYKYQLRFRRQTAKQRSGEIPPVNEKGFWSVTMYDLPDEKLVDNPINRSALGIPLVGNHALCPNADGSVTFYIQTDAPPDVNSIEYCNWLPSPAGNYLLFLRMYYPDPVVTEGKWIPPAVRKVP